MQPALDGAAGHLTLGQWHRLMGALIAQRTDGASGTDQAHGAAAEVKVDWAAAADLVQTAGPHPAASGRAGAAHRQPARWSPEGSRAAGPAHPVRTGSSRQLAFAACPAKTGLPAGAARRRLVLVTYRSVPCFAPSPAYVPAIYTNNL